MIDLFYIEYKREYKKKPRLFILCDVALYLIFVYRSYDTYIEKFIA